MPSALQLPIIDISSFLTETVDKGARLETAAALHSACKDVGFFYVTGFDKVIPQSVLDEALKRGHDYFEKTPQGEKDALSITKSDGARGYQRENVTLGKKDFHEGIDFYRPVDDSHPLRTNPIKSNTPYPLIGGENQWPNDAFRTFLEDYTDKMSHLGSVIMSAIGLGLANDSTVFEKYVDKSFWAMRVIGYPPLQSKDDIGISCGQHCDYGLLTLLNQDPIAGSLQVRLPSTGEWIAADRIENALVVNIGDMVEIMTNGMYKSTLHRVIHKGNRYRVSVPFFFEPNFDAIIEPLSVCPSPKPVKGTKYGDHLIGKVSGNFKVES